MICTKKKRMGARGNRHGQTLVEYALILALISVVAITVLITMGTNIKTIFTHIGSSLSSATASH